MNYKFEIKLSHLNEPIHVHFFFSFKDGVKVKRIITEDLDSLFENTEFCSALRQASVKLIESNKSMLLCMCSQADKGLSNIYKLLDLILCYWGLNKNVINLAEYMDYRMVFDCIHQNHILERVFQSETRCNDMPHAKIYHLRATQPNWIGWDMARETSQTPSAKQ